MNDDHMQPPNRMEWAVLVILVFFVAIIGSIVFVQEADAAAWTPATATWYGPGFYGNRTACGQTYTARLRGTAHMTKPCGSRLTICRYERCVRVRVIDRGAFRVAFDLSARTAMDLCACWRPYTMRVRWRDGWGY